MKFYSETLHKVFNSVEDLEAAEKKVAEKEAQSIAIKEKYKKYVDNIVKNFNAIMDIDKNTEIRDEDCEEMISYLMEKIIPLIGKIRLW